MQIYRIHACIYVNLYILADYVQCCNALAGSKSICKHSKIYSDAIFSITIQIETLRIIHTQSNTQIALHYITTIAFGILH